jgi:hypothetical protein
MTLTESLMTPQDIAQYRLYHQQIATTRFKKPSQVVAWLGAMQAQDYAGAKWSIGLRLPDATDTDIEQAIADKTIVRTWPMRGTLHFVSPEDVRWMLALLTPRIIANSARRHAQLELDEAIFARAKDLLVKALQGGKQLTRQEMMDLLEQAGIATGNQRGYHILGWLAQTGFICFGPMQGKQQTFVLLDEWVSQGKNLTHDESLAELAKRYFTSHGPATLQDFMGWSGLVAADARAGLDMVKPQLIQEIVNDQTYWMSPDISAIQDKSPMTYLLPGFDEYLLGYKDRTAVLETIHSQKITPGNNGVFNPTIVIDGRVAGTWKRTFKKDTVIIETSPFASLNEAETRALTLAAERYGAFVNMPILLA